MSGITTAIAKFGDDYSLKARLIPALLAALPGVLAFALLLDGSSELGKLTLTIFFTAGGLYVLADVARRKGKAVEERLYRSWDGKPTTQLLRHRDVRVEPRTKQRLHAYLAAVIGTPFPSREIELRDPKFADEIYNAAFTQMLPRISDSDSRLQAESIAYGFRRNALGLKKLGIMIAIFAIVWAAWPLAAEITSSQSATMTALLSPLFFPNAIVIMASVGMLALWLLHFTNEGARLAAFTYAERAIQSCLYFFEVTAKS